MAELTTGDLALMRDDGMGGNNSFMWIFALLLLIYGGGGLGFGGGRFPMPDVATNGAMTAGFNNQALRHNFSRSLFLPRTTIMRRLD